jgi:hypothetical protein
MNKHENAPRRRRMSLADAEDHIEQSIRSGGIGPITERDVEAAAVHDRAQRATGAIVPSHELSPRAYLIMCGSVRRAMDLMAELDTQRAPADLDRVRHGVSHELESLARALEMPSVRGRHASTIIVDDVPRPDSVPLPFHAVPCSGFCGTSTDPDQLCDSCLAEVIQSSRQAGE